MNKMKKIFISIGTFFTGFISKIYEADALMTEVKYGVVDPEPTVPTLWERILSVGKLVLPIALFFIGLIVILSKKITKKIKVIIISILVILAIFVYMLMN